VGAIYVQPLAGGQTRRLTTITRQLYGIAWVNNLEILFGTGALGGGSLLRAGIEGRSEPEPVLAALNGARNPAIVYPAKAPARLAYGRFVYDYNIWRMEIEPEPDGCVRMVTEPAAVISSTLADVAPQFSPDGQRIAFSSDRDGYREIWVGASDGSNQAQLTTLKSTRCGSPSWSPDGRQIAFDSLASGNNDIWLVGSEGGLPKRLTTEPSNDARPSWSRDGRWIYFRSDRSGFQQIWKIPSSEPYTPAVQVTRNGACEAKESLDGKLLYYVKIAPGLWSTPVEGGEETLLNESVMNSNWSLAASGVVSSISS
jgi:dipeptidyl aminopeptidase/acylaminoacyl peptidase